MNQHIDQFRETLRLKLMQADSDLSELKATIDAKAGTAERQARACLDEVATRIKAGEGKAAEARAQIETWVKQRTAEAIDSIEALKAKGEKATLQASAKFAEDYAAAAVVVAVAAIDEAERATVEAWLTRSKADKAAG